MSGLRVVVCGLGVQGRKRVQIAGADAVATIDPFRDEATYRDIAAVPADSYDAALLCIPDGPKLDLIEKLVAAGKHVLVEKPLLTGDPARLARLETQARATGTVVYTAYNHRFEPHIATLKDVLAAGTLGRVYRVRFFYGNGTARDVRQSDWRDQGAGVLPDLGSHLLDMLLFLFGGLPEELRVWSARRFENRSFDHVIAGADGEMLVEMEMSLLSWRNHFVAELYGEKGSAHIDSLCKWGPSTLTLRHRILPSGRPTETATTLVRPDPTWALEYAAFKNLCAARAGGNLGNDIAIDAALAKLIVDAA